MLTRLDRSRGDAPRLSATLKAISSPSKAAAAAAAQRAQRGRREKATRTVATIERRRLRICLITNGVLQPDNTCILGFECGQGLNASRWRAILGGLVLV